MGNRGQIEEEKGERREREKAVAFPPQVRLRISWKTGPRINGETSGPGRNGE